MALAGSFDSLSSHYFRLMSRRAFHVSDVVFVPTETIRRESTFRFGNAGANAVVTYEGFDVGSLEGTPPYGNQILYVAGYYPHKGHLRALKAFDVLYSNRGVDKPLLVFRGHIQDEDYHRRVIGEIADSPASSRVKTVSYAPDSTTDDIFQSAAILLALSHYEGFGLPLVEAQSRGIPVVCSDIPTFRETMGESAIFVDSENAAEVSDALNSLLSDSNLYRRKSEQGRRNSLRFSWDNMAAATVSGYRLAAARSRQRRN